MLLALLFLEPEVYWYMLVPKSVPEAFFILDANCTAKIIKLIGLDNIVAGIDSIINTAGSYNGIVIIAPVEQNRLACFAIGAFFYDFADSFSFGLGGIGEFQTGSVACNDLFQRPGRNRIQIGSWCRRDR